MKNFLRTKLWPVVAGLLAASIIMMLFEAVNSIFFPLPESLMNSDDIQALQAFTASLPWNAFVMVFLGWVVGSFVAGVLVTRITKERIYRMSLVVGAILTLLGVANNALIGHPLLFNIISLPMFMVFTYLGHRYARQKYTRKD